MSKVLDELNAILEPVEASYRGDEIQLRLDLAEIIWNVTARNGWTQGELARRSGLYDSEISNLVHGNQNCTFAKAAKVTHALGVKVKLKEIGAFDASNWRITQGNTRGQEQKISFSIAGTPAKAAC